MNLSREVFFGYESKLRKAGFSSDFDDMLTRLQRKEHLSPDEFAKRTIYVVLAGGFKQQTAKEYHKRIMNFLYLTVSIDDKNMLVSGLLKIFRNRNKINAIADIWQNRKKYCMRYYDLFSKPLQMKLDYLEELPFIGPITKNHLARNLGEDVPKYDIWIQRLGVLYSGRSDLEEKINNSKLDNEVKVVCDEMFKFVKHETGLPVGYIDLVLWRACEQHMMIMFHQEGRCRNNFS